MPVAVALGIKNLKNILNEKYYRDLDGGILESFGLLFSNNMRLYVCPIIDENNDKLIDIHNLQIMPHLKHLYLHLIDNGYIYNLDKIDKNYLRIKSDEVLHKIRSGDSDWDKSVPDQVITIINERKMFLDQNKSNM